jgi:hypothetical protein
MILSWSRENILAVQDRDLPWISQLYEETHQHWQNTGRDPNGYAIFYSPVSDRPKLLIIGYNPGGSTEDFQESNVGVPSQHEYIHQDYPLAKKMRGIFHTRCLKELLDTSVKLNLHYFRSRNDRSLRTSEQLNNFFYYNTTRISQKLQPQMIVTEGFKTFEKLIGLLNAAETTPQYLNKRKILRAAWYDTTPIVGLLHPTGCRGVSKEIQMIWSSVIEQRYQEVSSKK